jgi:hypothetical protein
MYRLVISGIAVESSLTVIAILCLCELCLCELYDASPISVGDQER